MCATYIVWLPSLHLPCKNRVFVEAEPVYLVRYIFLNRDTFIYRFIYFLRFYIYNITYALTWISRYILYMHQMRNGTRDITMALVSMARIRIMLALPQLKDDVVVVITRDESACTRARARHGSSFLSTMHYACGLPRSLMRFLRPVRALQKLSLWI